jgi:HK97 family phage prohead protease
MEPELERRSFTIREIRASEGDEPTVITGYAAVFNELSENLGGFYERIEQGAFAGTLESADVRALWNHDPNYPLGRTRAGTLELSEDETGLAFKIRPPDTSYAKDLLVSMRRGDVDQMSFGFRTIRDRWEQIGGQVIRTLLEVELFDVSPVTFPAYPQTSAAVRSKLEALTAAGQESGSGAEDRVIAQARNAHRKRRLQLLKIK